MEITVHQDGYDTVSKGDSICQWNTPIVRPQKSKIPKPNDIKLDASDYIGDVAPHANFGISILTEAGAQLHMHKLLSFSVSIFYTPVTYFTSVCTCRDCTV